MWTMNNADMNVAKKLGLTSIKKYQRRARQYEIELDCLYEQIPALAIFVRYLRRVYDNEKLIENINAKQNIDPKWVISFFVQLYKSY